MSLDVSRRCVLFSTASLFSLVGCDLLSTDPAGVTEGRRRGRGANGPEPPQLAELVEQGKLQPLRERLPERPLVVEPVDRLGVYGGTWQNGILGAPYLYWADKIVGNENLVRYDPAWTTVIPNVAESFDVGGDGRVYTFKLRPGLRWSDGEPFTSADIQFWYEDVLLDDELTETKPLWFVTDGELGAVEIIDDYTVVFEFAEPNGFFLENLASSVGAPITSTPAHYLRKFHKHHAPDVQRAVREAGADDWVALFRARADKWSNPEMPVLDAWRVTTPIGKGSQVVVERNPYYWKVDPKGAQLPYIDRIVFDVVNDQEVMVLKAMNGEVSLVDSRSVTTLRNKPNLAKNRESGGYDFVQILPSEMNQMHIALNLTHKDPVKRQIFTNKDFRIGLSYAINRHEIINSVFQRQGEPWQAAPRKETPFYHERLAKQYTEYDVEKANDHLDRAGYASKDSQGFRLGPDGQRISFAVEVDPASFPDLVDCLELVREYWRDVGIEMSIKTEDRSLLLLRKRDSEHDALVWKGDAGMRDALIKPDRYVPIAHTTQTGAGFGQAWQLWHFTNGVEGEEPPAVVRKQQELYDEMQLTVDKEARIELMKQILDIAAEQFYLIGTSLPPPAYTVVQDSFHNVPKSLYDSDIYPSPAPTNPAQYFIE